MTITITGIRREGKSIIFLFSDKTGREYNNIESVRDDANNLSLDSELLKRIAVASCIAQDPDLKNPEMYSAVSVSLDLTKKTLLERKTKGI